MEPNQHLLDALTEHDDFVRQVAASKLSPLTPLAAAIWSRWKGRTRMPVWQAAALLAGFEPVHRLQSANFAAATLASERGMALETDGYTETPLLERLRHNLEFCSRLALLVDRLGGAEMDEFCPAKIADVLAVAREMGWSVPDEFEALASGANAPGAAPGSSARQAPCPEAMGTETAEARQARRYQMCVDAGLTMPSDTYARLPRGIYRIAKAEGITRQALAEDLKAHIGRVRGR